MSEEKKSSVVEGLAAYKARKAAEEQRKAEASKPKFDRFNLEKDGDSVVFRFAQEIDLDATHYSEEAGIGFVNIEHQHPHPKLGWLNRGNCTTESQGACLPCQKGSDYSVEWDQRKGWKPREKFYINVVAGEPREVQFKNQKGQDRTKHLPTDIDVKTGDGHVYLLEQGTYNGIWDQLATYAVDDETILESYWKITRKGGEFNNTSYILTKGKTLGKDAKDVSEFELINIREDVLKEIPYNQQEAFYHRNIEEVAPVASEGGEAKTPVSTGAGTSGTEAAW